MGNPWKPVVKFEKFVFWPSLEKVRLFLTRGKPVFYPWKPVKTRPKNMGFWGSWQDAPRRFFTPSEHVQASSNSICPIHELMGDTEEDAKFKMWTYFFCQRFIAGIFYNAVFLALTLNPCTSCKWSVCRGASPVYQIFMYLSAAFHQDRLLNVWFGVPVLRLISLNHGVCHAT